MRRSNDICFVYLLLEHFCRDNNKTRYLFKCYSPEIIIIIIINASIHLIYRIHSLRPTQRRCASRKFARTQREPMKKQKPKHSHKLRTNDELFIIIFYTFRAFACESAVVALRRRERENEVNSFRWWLQSWNYSNKKQPLKIIWHGKWFFIKSVSFRWMDFPLCAAFLIYTILPRRLESLCQQHHHRQKTQRRFYLCECVANSTKRLPIAFSCASAKLKWIQLRRHDALHIACASVNSFKFARRA